MGAWGPGADGWILLQPLRKQGPLRFLLHYSPKTMRRSRPIKHVSKRSERPTHAEAGRFARPKCFACLCSRNSSSCSTSRVHIGRQNIAVVRQHEGATSIYSCRRRTYPRATSQAHRARNNGRAHVHTLCQFFCGLFFTQVSTSDMRGDKAEARVRHTLSDQDAQTRGKAEISLVAENGARQASVDCGYTRQARTTHLTITSTIGRNAAVLCSFLHLREQRLVLFLQFSNFRSSFASIRPELVLGGFFLARTIRRCGHLVRGLIRHAE